MIEPSDIEANDRVWGQGNWVRCEPCPRDPTGLGVFHHKDFHDGPVMSPLIRTPSTDTEMVVLNDLRDWVLRQDTNRDRSNLLFWLHAFSVRDRGG